MSAVFGVSVNQIRLAIVRAKLAVTRSSWTRGPAFPFNPRFLAKINQVRSCLHNWARVSVRRLHRRRTPSAALPLPLGAGFLVSANPTLSSDFERDLDDQ